MTRIDRVFVTTVSLILLSIPVVRFLITSTEKIEVTVPVLEKEFVKNPVGSVIVPAHRFSSGGVATFPVQPYWLLKVKIDDKVLDLEVSPQDPDLLNAQYMDVRYQYLRDGGFRLISFTKSDGPPTT